MIYLIVISCLVALVVKNFRKIRLFSRTFGRDMRILAKYSATIYHAWNFKRRQATVAKIFTEAAKRHPEKVAFYFEDQTWTFQDVENFSNKVAHYFQSQGYKRGDNMALFLGNIPEFVGIWLGLSKIGAVTVMININLSGDSLVHCIQSVDSKCVIYGSDLKNAIAKVSRRLPNVQLYQLDDADGAVELDGARNLGVELENQPDVSPREEIQKGKSFDGLMYVFTSGTTGLPKAVLFHNFKYILASTLMRYCKFLDVDDIVYVFLPMYHTAGGVVGAGHCVVNGGSVALRRIFSGSHFWTDCIKYKCTATIYLGEICRYLLAQHKNDDRIIEHSVTKFIGGGLRPQIWNEFVKKFNIKHIYEMYGSTEGNTNLFNFDSTPGSIGCVPFFLKYLYPVILVKCDLETAQPIRGEDGLCQRCQSGEPGLGIGKISKKTTMVEYSGYADEEATEKKLVRNVFQDGDVYFNSGDILEQDDMGNFYFKDRIGDTFRWKGENVSTAEVEGVISNILNFTDAVVYGVEIPNTDGKAGMAAIVQDSEVDIADLAKKLREDLPPYAVPRFVRIVPSIDVTATFKIQKTQLQKEGFDIEKIKDEMFVYDAKTGGYVELTREKYDDVMCGNIRL